MNISKNRKNLIEKIDLNKSYEPIEAIKILKTDIDKYMESDDELVKLKSKVEYIQTVIDFLDSTIKQISNRGFQIKNAIDWRKFTSGAI